MGSPSQLEATVRYANRQIRMRTVPAWNDNSNVRHVEQRQVIRRITQGENLHVRLVLLLF